MDGPRRILPELLAFTRELSKRPGRTHARLSASSRARLAWLAATLRPERPLRLPKSQMFDPVERDSPLSGSACSDRVQSAPRHAPKGPPPDRNSRIRAQRE